MLKGRLGIEMARIPYKSRAGTLYLERCRISIENGSLLISMPDAGTTLEVPYQRLSAILLGPGGSITHDALRHLAAHGTCLIAVGTGGVRCYSAPPVFERDSTLARQQATYWAAPSTRLMVALRMYEKRFGERPRVSSTDALRGMEAARIKRTYELSAQEHGIPWRGRHYDRTKPEEADTANQAINHAVTAVEALVTAAVAATATIPQLGFLHEDSAKSWILDICDLYRTSVTVPIAFRAAKVSGRTGAPLDRTVRQEAAEVFRRATLVDQAIEDIKELLA